MAELQSMVRDFENFLDVTQESRSYLERDDDYVHHKQWTEEEAETLRGRGQAPVVINRIKTKVNLLNGVQRQRRTDPKALPRTPRHEESADAITDAIRYVCDNVDMQNTSSEVFNDMLIAYGAAIVEMGDDNGEPEIQVNRISWDRFYYDPHSRRPDFSDAKFMGIVLWMDKDDAVTMFPGKADDIEALLEGTSDTVDGSTYDDKPTWIDRKRNRVRICQHYFKEKGTWMVSYFSKDVFLIEPKPSTYLDEFGNPDCPIEAQSLYVDRDNNRYGEVRAYIWIQDEINHRRTKLLYHLSVRQTIGEKGAVDDVNEMKRQLARPDGHVEYNPGMEFQLADTNDMAAGQLQLYQESKQEIDSIGANAALSGTQEQSLSGRAIQSLQQGGLAELGGLFDAHKSWERRIYRQVWNRIKQFWDAEKWIRVTDDEDNLKWVGLNQPVTFGELLMEQAEQGDVEAQAMLQENMDDPRLNEVVEVRNNVTEMDVDIVLTETPDYATLRQEQFETLANLAQAYGPEAVPFEVMLELSDMGHKKQIKEKLKGDVDPEQQAAQAQLASEQMQREIAQQEAETENKLADSAAKRAKALKDAQEAEAQQIENMVVKGQLRLG